MKSQIFAIDALPTDTASRLAVSIKGLGTKGSSDEDILMQLQRF